MKKLEPGLVLQVGSHSVEIVSYLAEGGFAHIYTVKYTPIENNQDIAVLKRVLVQSKKDLNLLRKEVETMKRLSASKYVVRYYDSNAQKLEDGTYEVLVLMEYCAHGSLLDYMNLRIKTKLSFEEIAKIMYQISSALYTMHRQNLIHRDLKIENVLIDSFENFKLADFGSTSGFIAPPKTQEEFQYIANDILHNTTPQYRAPEMIDLYRQIPIDNKSDIWALGVFLYKLMYYTTPFEAQGDLAILHGYFQFPETPKYSSKLKNLVIIMLQVHPNIRPNIYQVVNESCKLLNKSNKADDFYGQGPYDYDTYERFQRKIQIEQQQQLQQQQQAQLLQQQYMEQHRRQQQAENHVPSAQPVEYNNADIPVEYFEQQSKKLTRSKEPSVADLNALNSHDEVDGVKAQDADESIQEFDKEVPLTPEDDVEIESLNEVPDLDSVQERYPDLNDLDEGLTWNKYPEIEPTQSSPNLTPFETQQTSLPDGPLSQSSSAKASSVNITIDSANENDQSKLEPNVSNKGNYENETRKSIKNDKPKLNLVDTEAWTINNTPDPVPSNDVKLEGVFHSVEKDETVPTQNRPILTEKSSFDKLFEFEPYTEPAQGNVTQSREIPITQSKNPFPLTQQNPSKNPFPASLRPDIYKSVPIQTTNANPWFKTSTSNQPFSINNEPYQTLQPSIPIEIQHPYTDWAQSPNAKKGTINLQHKIKSRTIASDYSQPEPRLDHVQGQPVLQSQTEEKLIDVDDVPAHPIRPKFDLSLLDYDVSDMNTIAENERARRVSSGKDESDTDSEGNLRVEEIVIEEKSSKTNLVSMSTSIPKTPVTKSNSLSSTKSGSALINRKSSEIKNSIEIPRLTVGMEELDLNEDVIDGGLDNDEDQRHSRRSFSLKRGSNLVKSRSKSRSNRRSEEGTTSTKRKSFLGF